MRMTRTLSPARRLLLHYLYAYRQIIFYAALFLIGVFCGALFLKHNSGESLQKLSLLVASFVRQRVAQGVAQTFLSSLSSACLMLAFVFLCGFCAVAQPAILLLPLFRGLGFGCQAGYLYAQYGFSGVGYVALVLLPHMVLSTLVLLSGCSEAFRMSNAYFLAAKQQKAGVIDLRVYCGKFLLLLLLMLFSCALDTGCTLLFGRFFSFAA